MRVFAYIARRYNSAAESTSLHSSVASLAIIKEGTPHIKEGSLSLHATLWLNHSRLALSLDINRSRIDREARILDYGYNL